MRFSLLCLMFGVVLSWGMPAFAQANDTVQTSDRVRVAFINPGYGDRGFWKDVRDTMQVAADQFGFDLFVFDSNRDQKKMIDSAQSAFDMNPPADYIIAVNEHQQGSRIVLEAEKRSIPVIMLLNGLTKQQKENIAQVTGDVSGLIFTLTPDNERAGFEIAQSLIDGVRLSHTGGLPRTICLLSIAGDRHTPASLQRLEGLDLALKQFPVLNEKRRLVANWSFDEAYRQTAAWITGGQCLDAVWAANDDIALGAIAAIEQAGMTAGTDVFVGGLNWSEKGMQNVANGKMTMTHGGHFLAGAWVMVLLNDYIAGVEVLHDHPEISFRMEAINQGNLAHFERIFGTRDWKNIDFSQFSLEHQTSGRDYYFGVEGLAHTLSKD